MSKRTKRVNKTQTRDQTKADTSSNRFRLVKRVTLIISVIAGAIATITGILAGLPRPTVLHGDSVDNDNPMSAPFTITNSSIFPLAHVSAYLGLGDLI